MHRLGRALIAADCNWRISDLGWIYTLFFVLLGLSAATWGGWLERAGPRKAGVVSALWLVRRHAARGRGRDRASALADVAGFGRDRRRRLGPRLTSRRWSTLIKWFPDRRGMATGMAINGLRRRRDDRRTAREPADDFYRTDTSVGVWQTFVTMAAIYFVFMLGGAFGYRLPPAGWRPEGWQPKAARHLVVDRASAFARRAQDEAVLADLGVSVLNVSAGIGVIAWLRRCCRRSSADS